MCDFCNFIRSGPVSDARLGPITVCRVLMSSHLDKLLNLERPLLRSSTHRHLIPEQEWLHAGGASALLQGSE